MGNFLFLSMLTGKKIHQQQPDTPKYDKLSKLKELNKDYHEYQNFVKTDGKFGKQTNSISNDYTPKKINTNKYNYHEHSKILNINNTQQLSSHQKKTEFNRTIAIKNINENNRKNNKRRPF